MSNPTVRNSGQFLNRANESARRQRAEMIDRHRGKVFDFANTCVDNAASAGQSTHVMVDATELLRDVELEILELLMTEYAEKGDWIFDHQSRTTAWILYPDGQLPQSYLIPARIRAIQGA